MLRNKSDLSAALSKRTRESLTTMDISNNDILKVIRIALQKTVKTHGKNMISIRMGEICDGSICKPLVSSQNIWE